jgi:hypothetical protein
MNKFTHICQYAEWIFDEQQMVPKAAAILEGILKARSPRLSDIVCLQMISYVRKTVENSQREIEEDNKQKLAGWNKEVLFWNNAMQRWNSLYYCGHDDCVFIPDENTFAPSKKMLEFIYERQSPMPIRKRGIKIPMVGEEHSIWWEIEGAELQGVNILGRPTTPRY